MVFTSLEKSPAQGQKPSKKLLTTGAAYIHLISPWRNECAHPSSHPLLVQRGATYVKRKYRSLFIVSYSGQRQSVIFLSIHNAG